MERFRLDDPLQSTQIHLVCGLWGVIALGLYDMDRGLLTTGKFDLIKVDDFVFNTNFVFIIKDEILYGQPSKGPKKPEK